MRLRRAWRASLVLLTFAAMVAALFEGFRWT
jgi:hypothetical protein